MAEVKDIVRLAVDAYKGTSTQFSTAESMETLRQALVAANNGSTKLNYKAIRDGKCNGLFTIIEEILSRTVVDGLQGDEFFNSLVDFRNVAMGDKNVFYVEDAGVFVVADAADGTQGIRRQRLGGMTETAIPTSFKLVKIYDELNRVLSGQVDLNHMINKVSEAFRQKLLGDIYTLWCSASSAEFGIDFFPAAGAFDEDTFLSVVGHVEAAANGKAATIIGTKKALLNLKLDINEAKSDIYGMGYVGKYYGNNVVMVPQRHQAGTTQFAMEDDTLTVIAGDDKPIKVVYEGEPLIITGDPLNNADLTHEYLFGEKWGAGIVLANNTGIGKYTIQ